MWGMRGEKREKRRESNDRKRIRNKSGKLKKKRWGKERKGKREGKGGRTGKRKERCKIC